MRIEWEYDLVEKPFCEQLRRMGWEWLEGDTDVPELTERANFREVLLRDRLRAALRKINLGPGGQPWLDDERIDRAVRDLEQLGAHRLIEANQEATRRLIQGTVTAGRPDWDRERPQPLRFIDFDNWERNDFLVINQFKVELTSGRGHIIPDAVLFVNGIPIGVAEFKSPGIENPLGEAINQLLRYSNQRKELFPTQYSDDEGVERLFHFNQLLIASNAFERGGIVWHTQGSGKSLSMVFLVRKMRTKERLKHFKVVVVTDRTDLERQLRATAGLTNETARPSERDLGRRESPTARTQRILQEATPDIVFAMLQKYQQTDRKAAGHDSVAMTIVRKEKKPGTESPVVEREVTFEENVHFEEFPVLNESEHILVLVDEAHRSHTHTLHRHLRRALPNAAIIGFTGTPILSKEKLETREIFGDFIDKYLLDEAELDGATVPILYEGRTADGFVRDAPTLDQLFEDMFRGYSPQELAIIKAKYATEGDVLEAPLLIEQKAQDMLRHYVGVVLPEGFKAQVVATSRAAAVRYHEKLVQAHRALLAELDALPPAVLALPEKQQENLDPRTRFLVQTHRHLHLLRVLEIEVAISGEHNDPESWWGWSDKAKQETRIERFKRRLAVDKTEKTDPLAILIVNNMLLTGFDAPVEQVLYLDRKLVAHDLLQAIARVNRTCGRKRCGYVVDYVGVARHLTEALAEYDREDTRGALLDITTELPKLLDRRARAVAVFTDRGIRDLKDEVQGCVALLDDLKIRADFINKLRLF